MIDTFILDFNNKFMKFAVRCPYGREELATIDDVMQQNPELNLDDVTLCYSMPHAQNVSLAFDLEEETQLASVVVAVRNCERVTVLISAENNEEIQASIYRILVHVYSQTIELIHITHVVPPDDAISG